MKKIFTTFVLGALTLLAGSETFAADQAVIKTRVGQSIRVEVCADGIFHVQVSPDGTFPEALMQRYGVVRSDWGKPEFKRTDKGGVSSFTTGDATLSVNKTTGVISVVKGGKTLVGDIKVLTPSDKLTRSLAQKVNDTFSNMDVASNGGIIGDDNGRFSEKDKQESGDVDKSCVISISMESGERFYGGGSASHDHIQHRGELLRMWTCYQHTEMPIPFMMSSRGWGVYNNDTRKQFFDLGTIEKDRFNIYNTQPCADFYIFAGDGMRSIIDRYTQVTGRNYVLPKWAYGFCYGPNMREDQWNILNDAVNFRRDSVPCDLLWLEPQWMSKRYDFSTAKKWNSERFSVEPYWLEGKDIPKKEYPRLFIGKLHSMGFKLGLWLCEEYDFSITEEDAIAEREGRPQSGQEHWMDHLKAFLDYGVDGFKLDPARTIDEHTFWDYYNGLTDKEMHNINQVLLTKQMTQMSRSHTGKRTWHHYCGGWAGSQHWGAANSGDNGGGKTALYDQLNLGMSGYMNMSCDVMSVEKELEMAGLHFGMFLPWTQVNSWFSMMHPSFYGESEKTIYRNCVQTRYEIMPYLYSMALEGAVSGMPMVRSMPLQFPDDRKCDDMCYQYMFGDAFLVGIFTDEIYLPRGDWYDYWTGSRISSKGDTFKLPYPADRAGLLYVKGGSIVPTAPVVQTLGDKPFDNIIFKVYPCGESSYVWRDDDGSSYDYESGLIASRTVRSSAGEATTDITVSAVEGSFKTMPESVEMTFDVWSEKDPASVSIDSQKAEWCREGAFIRVCAGAVKTDKEVCVKINY